MTGPNRSELRVALRGAETARPWRAGSVEKDSIFAPYDAGLGTERNLFRANRHFPHEGDVALAVAAVNALEPLLDAHDDARDAMRLARADGAFAENVYKTVVLLMSQRDEARRALLATEREPPKGSRGWRCEVELEKTRARAGAIEAALRAVVAPVHIPGRFADEAHDACPVCRLRFEACPVMCAGAIGRDLLGERAVTP